MAKDERKLIYALETRTEPISKHSQNICNCITFAFSQQPCKISTNLSLRQNKNFKKVISTTRKQKISRQIIHLPKFNLSFKREREKGELFKLFERVHNFT